MEQTKLNKFIVSGIVVNSILSLIAIGAIVFFVVRVDRQDKGAAQEAVVTDSLAMRGFIGVPTTDSIAMKAGIKSFELRGHVPTTQIPSHEPVGPADVDKQIVRVDENTKITKVTNVPGDAPMVEELAFADFTSLQMDAEYLARYEAFASSIPADAAATSLDIYIGTEFVQPTSVTIPEGE